MYTMNGYLKRFKFSIHDNTKPQLFAYGVPNHIYIILLNKIRCAANSHHKVNVIENVVFTLQKDSPVLSVDLFHDQLNYFNKSLLYQCNVTIRTFLVLKQETFNYSSSYWQNKQKYNPAGGLSGLDDHETKLPTYWSTSFKELCVGMKVDNNFKFLSISYPGSSLYNLIADGMYRATNLGRQKWNAKKLQSMQNPCKETAIMKDSMLQATRTFLPRREQELD